MKAIMKSMIMLLSLTMLFSCNADNAGNSGKPDGSVSMRAIVDDISERITVTVTESPYTSGVHWVITPNETEYYGSNGKQICRTDLRVGDEVEIRYSGQVMMSYPPQIVAARITVI